MYSMSDETIVVISEWFRTHFEKVPKVIHCGLCIDANATERNCATVWSRSTSCSLCSSAFFSHKIIQQPWQIKRNVHIYSNKECERRQAFAVINSRWIVASDKSKTLLYLWNCCRGQIACFLRPLWTQIGSVRVVLLVSRKNCQSHQYKLQFSYQNARNLDEHNTKI